jgi:hypothetical protein
MYLGVELNGVENGALEVEAAVLLLAHAVDALVVPRHELLHRLVHLRA